MGSIDVVLIHGFNNKRGRERYANLIRRIESEIPDANIITPDYLEDYPKSELMTKLKCGKKTLSQYAAFCKKEIDRQRSSEKLFVLGMSMGGLITRVLIEEMGIAADAAILAGVPNNGVNISIVEQILRVIFKKAWVDEIKYGNKFMNKLNDELEVRNLCTKYYVMLSRDDSRVPFHSAGAVKYAERIEVDGDHWQVVPHPDEDPNGTSKSINAIMNIIKEAAA